MPASAAASRALHPAETAVLLNAPLPRPNPPDTRRAVRLRSPNPAALRARKAAAERRAGLRSLPQKSPRGPQPATAVFGALNQPGLQASDNTAANLGSPPDTTGAIGPSSYIEFVNSVVRAYSRSTLGGLGAPVPLDTFVGDPGFFVFDPQIQYDPVSSRWYYVADDCADLNCSTDNLLDIGWSTTPNPTDFDPTDGGDDWCHFFLSTGTLFDDYPKLGHDDNHIIIGANRFNGNTFVTARIWSISKPAPGDNSCAAPTAQGFGSGASPLQTADGDLAATPVPANTADSSANGYVVAADDPTELGNEGPKSQIMSWHVGGAPTAPTLVPDGNTNVSVYDVPAPVLQPGAPLDSLDARLTQAVAHADPGASGQEAVWTQHTVDGPGGLSVVRWYELLPGSSSPRQEGTISDSTNFVFNGAITPASNGRDAAINYNVGGVLLTPEIRAQSRRSGMTHGQMAGEVTLDTSAAANQDFTCTVPYGPPCRWGDYAGASPDPINADLTWGSNQTLGAPSSPPNQDDPHWRTRNFALVPEGSVNALPSAVFSASPNPASSGQAVTFDSSATSDPDGSIVDRRWDLDGNGTFETDTGTIATVSRAYSSPGTVTVRLRVTDNSGDTADAAQPVTIVGVSPPVVTPDTTAPLLTLSFKKVQKLRTVLRRGVAGKVRCNEVCTVRFQLQLPRTIAKRLHIAARYVAVGKITKRLAASRTTSVRIKLSRKARKRLARVHSVRTRLTARATDAAGNASKTKTRRITLKR